MEELPPPSRKRKAKDERPSAESKRGTKRPWWSLGWGSGDENAREKKRAKRSKEEEEVYSGLENQRNTCYLNSMLQCLYHVKGEPTFCFETHPNNLDLEVTFPDYNKSCPIRVLKLCGRVRRGRKVICGRSTAGSIQKPWTPK